MRIHLLSITMPDYQAFNRFCTEVLGQTPLRTLDSEGYSIKDPSSFLAILNPYKTPLDNLRKGYFGDTTFDHIHLSFIAAVSPDLAKRLSFCNLRQLTYEGKRETLIILTGSVTDWIHYFIRYCTKEREIEDRQFANRIIELIETTQLRECLTIFTKKPLADETYIIYLKEQRGQLT